MVTPFVPGRSRSHNVDGLLSLGRISSPRGTTLVFRPAYRAFKKAALELSWSRHGYVALLRPCPALPVMLARENRHRHTWS